MLIQNTNRTWVEFRLIYLNIPFFVYFQTLTYMLTDSLQTFFIMNSRLVRLAFFQFININFHLQVIPTFFTNRFAQFIIINVELLRLVIISISSCPQFLISNIKHLDRDLFPTFHCMGHAYTLFTLLSS